MGLNLKTLFIYRAKFDYRNINGAIFGDWICLYSISNIILANLFLFVSFSQRTVFILSIVPVIEPPRLQISRLLLVEGRVARSPTLWGHRTASDAVDLTAGPYTVMEAVLVAVCMYVTDLLVKCTDQCGKDTDNPILAVSWPREFPFL